MNSKIVLLIFWNKINVNLNVADKWPLINIQKYYINLFFKNTWIETFSIWRNGALYNAQCAESGIYYSKSLTAYKS